ncbi:MAG: hypothetical protein ACOCXX_05310 [Planctomycetota bacterium]
MSDFLIILAQYGQVPQDISALDQYIRPIINASASISHALALFVVGVGVIKAMAVFIRDALFGHTSADAIVESRPHDPSDDEDRNLDTLQEAEDPIARRAHADELEQDDKT